MSDLLAEMEHIIHGMLKEFMSMSLMVYNYMWLQIAEHFIFT